MSQAGKGQGGASQTCTYTSQCPAGMVCGPRGICQAECLDTRDCADGLVCEDGRCVAPSTSGGAA
jgi:hypothetical protein